MKRLSILALGLTIAAGCGDDVSRTDASMGGMGGTIPSVDGGGGDAPACSAVIVSPASQSVLGADDDNDRDSCANGFQTDVQVTVLGAATGTPVTLSVGGVAVPATTVSGNQAVFSNVTLPNGASTLTAQLASGAGCVASTTVTVDCNRPACQLTKPVITPAHPKLNGVPAAQGGDRASAPGSDYQAAFEVTTNVEDGQTVQLEVARSDQPTVKTLVSAMATGGKAVFNGVTLRPDGDFTVQAVCTNAAGIAGRSTPASLTVDTEGPALVVSEPVDERHYGPGDLTDGKFKVCANTTSADAADLMAARENMGKNLCAAIGMASPECAAVTKGMNAEGTGCVELTCPGGAPFDVKVTLKDEAGNAVEKTIQAVTCASTLPSVQIVSPAGDAPPYNDVAKRLLAANANQAFKDLDATKSGAQTDVVACTDRANSKARLLAGTQGSALAVVGAEITVAAAQPADGCPAGLGFVAKWSGATLPPSVVANGALEKPTELRVEMTDVSTAVGTSPATLLWVDAQAPQLNVFSPNPLCGLVLPPLDATRDVVVATDTTNVTLTVSNSAVNGGQPVSVPRAATSIQSRSDFDDIAFAAGENSVIIRAQDLAGNVTTVGGAGAAACLVKVGAFPVVTFVAPALNQKLCSTTNLGGACVSDADGNAAGWQGTLSVQVNLEGAPATTGSVKFSANGSEIGTAPISGGVASLPATLSDANALTLLAETVGVGGVGQGSASLNIDVDTVPPGAVTELAAAVLNRRETSYRLTWKAPMNGGSAAAGYRIGVSESPIDEGNFAASEAVDFGGSPAAPGAMESINVGNRRINTKYHFGVAAVDAVGNRGPVLPATTDPATFRTTILQRPSGGGASERFGNEVAGFSDLNGDGRSDLLVATSGSGRAFVFFGQEDFSQATTPSLTFEGFVEVRKFDTIGDIDKDGKVDLAITSPSDGNGLIYIFKGRDDWIVNGDSVYSPSDADYTLDLGAQYAGTFLGSSLARLGDFNGDGVDDFAVGTFAYDMARGRVIVIMGSQTFSAQSFTTLTISGEATLNFFGTTVVGMGRFYPNAVGTTLVVGATGVTGSAGRVYAFALSNGAATSLPASAALHFVDGPSGGSQYGKSLGLLGPIGGGGFGIAPSSWAAPGIADTGLVDTYFGNSVDGPFGTFVRRFVDSAATQPGQTGDRFGYVVFGGAFSGSAVVTSILGNTTPDIVMVPSKESGGASTIYVVDGARVSSLPATPNDVVGVADAKIPLPADWGPVPNFQNGMIRDIDGDGFGDIAVGEGGTGKTGRVLVVW